MTLRLQVALAATLLLAATGCENTGADTEAIISGELGIRVTTGSLMAATLATELALAVTETPEPGACPFASQDGDDLTLDFGTGCVPDSGTTTEPISGMARLIVAGGSGDFIGELQSLGFQDLPVVGEVSGSVTRAGDLLSADVQLTGLTWTDDGSDNAIDALFELSADSEIFEVNVSAGDFVRGPPPDLLFELVDVQVPRGGMGACFVPQAGSAQLERLAATANLDFSSEAASSGVVSVSYNDRDPDTLTLCP